MNWADCLRFAALHLGLGPAEFWRLSLKEWRTLTGGGEAPLTRRALETMLASDHPSAVHSRSSS